MKLSNYLGDQSFETELDLSMFESKFEKSLTMIVTVIFMFKMY